MWLKIASAIALWSVSLFLFVIIILVTSFAETTDISLYAMVIGIVVFNTVMWLVSPWIQDLMQRWLYKMSWTTYEEFEEKAPATIAMIKKLSQQYNVKQPRLWIIKDDNPTAFTYGSGPRNWRIIISEGMFKYCNDEEIAAVMAHEFWHIVHWDIAIMTLASTIIQLIYTLYIFARRMSHQKSGKKNPFGAIAIAAYAFYIVGTYVLLYLSRVREYYADQFAAEHADPNALASALVKVAYGIIATPDESHLIQSTQHLWLVNEKQSKNTGLVYHDGNIDRQKLWEITLYDLYNPWAKYFEFFSTHPVTWKRMQKLMEYTDKPVINFKELLMRYPLDTAKMRSMFWGDMRAFFMPAIVLWVLLYVLFAWLFTTVEPMITFVWSLILVLWTYMLSIAYRKFGESGNRESSIYDLMKNPYASPFHGQSVAITGEVIGKWTPWYVFSEDVVIQDDTGLLYADYHGALWFISNFWFSITKVKKLIGKQVSARWWFFRNQKSYLVLESLDDKDAGKTTQSFSKFWAYAVPVLVIVWGMLVILVGMSGGV